MKKSHWRSRCRDWKMKQEVWLNHLQRFFFFPVFPKLKIFHMIVNFYNYFVYLFVLLLWRLFIVLPRYPGDHILSKMQAFVSVSKTAWGRDPGFEFDGIASLNATQFPPIAYAFAQNASQKVRRIVFWWKWVSNRTFNVSKEQLLIYVFKAKIIKLRSQKICST